MNLIQRKIFIYPVMFLIIIFLFDKVFLLPEVRDLFIQPGGMLYYRLRNEQISRFKNSFKNKKRNERRLVVFGDSRSFALGDLVVKYLGYKNITVFNFSAPQALPAYHAYLAEKLLRNKDRPDYLLFGLSPDAFNRNSTAFGSPVLNFGVDKAFIEANRSHIPEKDFSVYLMSRRFALSGMQFSLKTLLERVHGTLSRKSGHSGGLPIQAIAALAKRRGKENPFLSMLVGASNPRLSHYSLTKSPQAQIIRKAKGAQYVWFGSVSDEILKRESERLIRFYLQNFVISPEQLYFFRKTMRLARLGGVRTIVFWPQVNKFLLNSYKKIPAIQYLWRQIVRTAIRENALAVNMNRNRAAYCPDFYDASHLSITCFPRITRYLIEEIKKM